jgi:hypothetical protein
MKLPYAIGFVVAGLALAVVGARAQSSAPPHDTFYFIGEINKASIVMLAETGIIPRPLASRIARGIRTAIDSQSSPGASRPTDYFDFEPMVIARRPGRVPHARRTQPPGHRVHVPARLCARRAAVRCRGAQ